MNYDSLIKIVQARYKSIGNFYTLGVLNILDVPQNPNTSEQIKQIMQKKYEFDTIVINHDTVSQYTMFSTKLSIVYNYAGILANKKITIYLREAGIPIEETSDRICSLRVDLKTGEITNTKSEYTCIRFRS